MRGSSTEIDHDKLVKSSDCMSTDVISILGATGGDPVQMSLYYCGQQI